MLARSGKITIRRLVALLFMTCLVVVAYAQDNERELISGSTIDGVIDSSNPAQVYFFRAAASDTATVTVATADGMALTVLITSAQGESIAQASDAEATGEVILADVVLAAGGVYYVTVFPAAGVEAPAVGAFSVTLSIVSSPAQQPAGSGPTPTLAPTSFQTGQVITGSGIQVSLRWDTVDDLNLQVRDPIGETLYWDSRTTLSGGTFGFDVNGVCDVVSPSNNVETASWPAGPVATGSYEILVYYRQSCTGDIASPVDFNVEIVVDGTTLPIISSTLQPPAIGSESVYISSFVIASDGTATAGASGPYTDTRVLPVSAEELLAAPSPELQQDVVITGLITSQQPFQTYRFSGTAGQIISIAMTATAGSLDTLLLVLDSSGNVVDANDDVETAVNTNSAINFLRLPASGTYIIVATRYGKLVGGTEGTYTLVVSGPVAADLPADVIALNLPSGDIEITLTWNTDADLRLLVRDPSLNSVFNDQTQVATGGQLVAFGNVNCNRAPTTPVSYIYWPNGTLRIGTYEVEVWYRSQCNDTRPVQFRLDVAVRDRLVFTRTANIEFTQRYLTNFTIEDVQGTAASGEGGIIGSITTLDYQSRLASAITITSGQNVPGAIGPQNMFDVYLFDGQAGDVVTIEMRTTNGNLDTFLFLVNPAGVEIAQNDDANETTNSLIGEILLNETGTYVIVATRFGAQFGGTSGAYNLSLRVDRP